MATVVNLNGINALDLNLSGTTTASTAAGVTTISNTPAQQLTLETNGTANGSQSLLNLAAGTNVTVTDNGTGTVTIASTASGGVTHDEPLTDGNANFIFAATLTTGGDIIVVIDVPN